VAVDHELGAKVRLGDHVALLGSCSWTDRTLVQDGDWYPKKTMSAEERLRYYATQFPLTEIDSTYYAPPAEQQARLWAERTPDGFRFDVKAYSLLTGHPTRPKSLWRDLREQLPPEVAEKRNVYASHLGADALEEAWRRFERALRPLHEAGKLGGVLFQYPPWFVPRRENRAEIDALRDRLPDYRICVEFRSPMWLAEERDRERTLRTLEEHRLVFVCVDAPEAGPTFAALAERGWSLSDVLITHHHADHIQGVPELKAKFPNLKVWGPAKDAARIPFLTHPVAKGDTARIGSLAAKVIETPGHTLGHIAYYFEEDEIAFCGDTLFSLGCGRAFETPYAVLWSSLMKLAALPGQTQLYCGHEYTEANGRFAVTIEPDNPILKARIEEVARLRAARRPTLPTTVAAELAANPFLRAEEPAVQAAVGMHGADPAAVFAEIRARKDRF